MSSKLSERREKRRTTKPYDRPKTFLQRVTNHVADYLPSWLNPTWMLSGSSEAQLQHCQPPINEVQDEETEEEPDEDLEIVEPPCASTSQLQESTSKRQSTLAFSEGPASYTRSPLQRDVSRCTQTIVNGDDHSDNSETSASTSGCSSLAPSQERKRTTASGGTSTQLKGLHVSKRHLEKIQRQLGSNPLFSQPVKGSDEPSTSGSALACSGGASTSTQRNVEKPRKSSAIGDHLHQTDRGKGSHSPRTSLWSEEGSQVNKRSYASRPQPVAPSKRPCFTPSAFGAPLRVSHNRSQSPALDSPLISPFYQGNTTYGGASAYKKARMNTPYNSNLRAEVIRVRQSGSREVLSSAAQKVLNVLENMSTPLTDAKKIPVEHVSTDFALSFTPSIYARRPIRHDTPVTLMSIGGPPRNSLPLQTSHLKQSSLLAALCQPVPSTKTPGDLTRSTSSLRSDPKEMSRGGKIRTKITKSHHIPSQRKSLEQELQTSTPDLPQVSLTGLPTFSFRVPTCTSTPILTTTTSKRTQPQLETSAKSASISTSEGFSFSSPIENRPPAASVVGSPQQESPRLKDDSFQFRSPLFKSDQADGNDSLRTQAATPAPKSPAVTINFKAPEKRTSISPLRRVKPTDDEGVKTAPEPQLIVGGSVMDILGKPAAEASKPELKGSSTTPSGGFGSAFQRKSNEWECSVCMVRNQEKENCCVSCTTPKPAVNKAAAAKSISTSSVSGFGSNFSAPQGSWCCNTCMVNNTESATCCVACTEPKPGVKNAVLKTVNTATVFSGFKSPGPKKSPTAAPLTWIGPPVVTTGTWECDACLVRNKEGSTKCCACETPRLNTASLDVKDNFTGYKFGAKSTDAKAAPFKFGLGQTTTTTSSPTTMSTASGFKDKTPPGSKDFKFGMPATSESPRTPKVSEGFKFGGAVNSSNVSAGSTFKFDSTASTDAASAGGFKFGIGTNSSPKKAVEVTFGGKKLGSDSSQVPSSTADDAKSEKVAFSQPSLVFGGQASASESKLDSAPAFKFGQVTGEPPASLTPGILASKASENSKTESVTLKEKAVEKSIFGTTAMPFNNTLTKATVDVPGDVYELKTGESAERSTVGVGSKNSLGPSELTSSMSVAADSTVNRTEKSAVTPVFAFGSPALPSKDKKEGDISNAPSGLPGYQFTFKNKETTDLGGINKAVSIFGSAPAITTASPMGPSMAVFPSRTSTTQADPKTMIFGKTTQAAPVGPITTSINTGSSAVLPAAITSAGGFVFGPTKPVQVASPSNAGGFTFSFGNTNAQPIGNVLTKPTGVSTPFGGFGPATTSTGMMNAVPAAVTSQSVPNPFEKISPATTSLIQQQPAAAPAVFTFGATAPTGISTPSSGIGAFSSGQPAQKSIFGGFNGPSVTGSPLAPPAVPAFGQQQQQPANTAASESFNFASSMPAPQVATNNMFQMGVPKPAAPATTNNVPSTLFRFGAPQEKNQPQSVFCAPPPQQPAGGLFTFGSSAPAPAEGNVTHTEGSPFVFGGATTGPANPGAQPFQFQAGNPASTNPFNATGAAGQRVIRKAVRRVLNKKK